MHDPPVLSVFVLLRLSSIEVRQINGWQKYLNNSHFFVFQKRYHSQSKVSQKISLGCANSRRLGEHCRGQFSRNRNCQPRPPVNEYMYTHVQKCTRSLVLRTHFKHYAIRLACFAARITSYHSNSRARLGHFPTVATLPPGSNMRELVSVLDKTLHEKNACFLFPCEIHTGQAQGIFPRFLNTRSVSLAILINSSRLQKITRPPRMFARQPRLTIVTIQLAEVLPATI